MIVDTFGIRYSVHAFGSTCLGLASDSSDLDLIIIVSKDIPFFIIRSYTIFPF